MFEIIFGDVLWYMWHDYFGDFIMWWWDVMILFRWKFWKKINCACFGLIEDVAAKLFEWLYYLRDLSF